MCFVREDDKDLCKHNSIVLLQFYQTELLFRSHDQMGHQGLEKVYNRIQKRFAWPGLKKACDKWISACFSYQQAKDPRKLRVAPTVILVKASCLFQLSMGGYLR